MRPGPLAPSLRPIFILVLALLGCGLEPRSLAPNLPPEIRLERPAVVSDTEQGQSLKLAWSAHDPDGRVAHYLFAIDPPSVDRVDAAWTRTQELSTLVSVPRHVAAGRVAVAGVRGGDEPRRFAVRAVDDVGNVSPPATMAFFADNIAPSVAIVSPALSPVFIPITPTSLDIGWVGSDLDGQITHYKYKLFGGFNPDFPAIPDYVSFATQNPESLLSQYGR